MGDGQAFSLGNGLRGRAGCFSIPQSTQAQGAGCRTLWGGLGAEAAGGHGGRSLSPGSEGPRFTGTQRPDPRAQGPGGGSVPAQEEVGVTDRGPGGAEPQRGSEGTRHRGPALAPSPPPAP